MSRLPPGVALAALLLTACGGGSPTGSNSGNNGPAPVASVSVTLASGALTVGGSTNATAALHDASGQNLTGRDISWSSSSPGIATVNAGGMVSALTAGTTTITATSEGKSGSAQLTVAPAPIASITVSLVSSTLLVGGTTQTTALIRDTQGNLVTGRTITWSSSSTAVATIASSGIVTAAAGGSTQISASVDNAVGSATLTVTPPVTAVTLTGSLRVKVGDSYSYTATAKLADGTVVQRPMTWGIQNPGTATITQAGVMTPTTAGTVTIVVTIDGQQWFGAYASYDWTFTTTSTTVGVTLPADLTVTNRNGVQDYPLLLVVCGTNSGLFSVGVAFNNIVTANGLVTYSGDNGTPISQTWGEAPPNYNILIYPALTNTLQKSFATTMATNHLLTFAFGEFLNGSHATQWRLTGMTAAIAPLLTACPAALMAEGGEAPADPGAMLRPMIGTPRSSAADRAARASARPQATQVPLPEPVVRATEIMVLRRVGQ